ncbi:hypothetical protein GJ496_001524 [Pomphorhynchus laevis]|nr:hypothetical protein GJ496_001524 [Pomphorhynchus laevis]
MLFASETKSIAALFFKRGKKFKKCWAFSNRKQSSPSVIALDYFDGLYSKVFENHCWPPIRLGLLSSPKYAAVINNQSYIAKSAIKYDLQTLGSLDLCMSAPNLSDDFTYQIRVLDNFSPNSNHDKTFSETNEINRSNDNNNALNSGIDNDFADNNGEGYTTMDRKLMKEEITKNQRILSLINMQVNNGPKNFSFETYFYENEVNYRYPLGLTAMAFDRGDYSQFPQPARDQKSLLAYYLMDAASLLPVLALNINHNDVVLDMCASPGGKSLAILQAAAIDRIVCNDVSVSRINRLTHVLSSFCRSMSNIRITLNDASLPSFRHNYIQLSEPKPNKVLIDAPCTNDRHSLFVNERNIFSRANLKEFQQLTSIQKNLLVNGLLLCATGGLIVYSTCTLNPYQNDCVVDEALRTIEAMDNNVVAQHNRFKVLKLSNTIENDFKYFFDFHRSTHYGSLVLPSIVNNYGPINNAFYSIAKNMATLCDIINIALVCQITSTPKNAQQRKSKFAVGAINDFQFLYDFSNRKKA